MKGYSQEEVARLLDVPPRWLGDFVRDGFLVGARDEAGETVFTFQDLVLLRTAKGLLDAEVAPARVRRALRRLRERLPDGRPLTAPHISAEGARVVVRDGNARFDPESGQALFDFEVRELERKVAPLARRAAARARADDGERSADEWFALGCQLEVGAPREARAAYERAVALDPAHADARVNLGRVLHAVGELDDAEAQYRAALAARPGDAIAAFNLGLVLGARGRFADAMTAYRAALEADPRCADAHYNLAQLYERAGQPQAALRHFQRYKKLTDGR